MENSTWTSYVTSDYEADNGTTEAIPDVIISPLLQYTEFWVAYYLNKYYPWVLCVIGVICNSAVLATTLIVKPFNSSSLYVASLAIVDSLALITKLLYTVLTAYDVPLGASGCAAIFILGYFLVHFAVWITAIITLERFVAVHFVFKVTSLFTMSRSRISLLATALILLVINSHILWTSTEILNPVNGLECGFKPEYIDFVQSAWYWIDASLSFLIPCAALIVLNVLILVKLKTRQVKRKSIFGGKNEAAVRARHQNRQLTVMLLTLSIGTTCLLMPLAVFSIVATKWNFAASAHSTAVYLLVSNVVHFLADCTHAINFFFCLFGGGRFRSVLRAYLCRCSGKKLTKQDRSLSTMKSISRQSCNLTSVSHINTTI